MKQRARHAVYGLSLQLLLSCSAVAATTSQTVRTGTAARLDIELVVRTVNNFRNQREVATFFRNARRAQVTAVHVNVKQDEDDERPSGQVYYASRIATVAAGYGDFDALAAAVTEGHRLGIKVYAWMPQFHDQEALRQHPAWQMQAAQQGRSKPYSGKRHTEFFINPIDPAVQTYERSLIEEVARNYRVDGISLDWLRFDDINMDTGELTRALARQEIGLDPLQLNFDEGQAATAIWQRWRTQKIAAYVRSVRQSLRRIRPDLKLGAFLLPPEFTEVGQNLASFSADLDEALPMAYFNDWGRSAKWVNAQLIPDVLRKKSANTQLKPTLDGTGSTAQNIDILVGIRKNFPQLRSVIWFSAGTWQAAEIQRIVTIHRTAMQTRQRNN
jgi:uncharacterized lipoprotein YddW (UPF0748 family)